MSYNERIRWKDHDVERPRTYNEASNADGSKTFTPAPGEIRQQGTPLSAENLNTMDEALQHINIAYDMLATSMQAEFRTLRDEIELVKEQLEELADA